MLLQPPGNVESRLPLNPFACVIARAIQPCRNIKIWLCRKPARNLEIWLFFQPFGCIEVFLFIEPFTYIEIRLLIKPFRYLAPVCGLNLNQGMVKNCHVRSEDRANLVWLSFYVHRFGETWWIRWSFYYPVLSIGGIRGNCRSIIWTDFCEVQKIFWGICWTTCDVRDIMKLIWSVEYIPVFVLLISCI